MDASHSSVVRVVLFAASSSAPLGSDPTAVLSLAELSLLAKKANIPSFHGHFAKESTCPHQGKCLERGSESCTANYC